MNKTSNGYLHEIESSGDVPTTQLNHFESSDYAAGMQAWDKMDFKESLKHFTKCLPNYHAAAKICALWKFEIPITPIVLAKSKKIVNEHLQELISDFKSSSDYLFDFGAVNLWICDPNPQDDAVVSTLRRKSDTTVLRFIYGVYCASGRGTKIDLVTADSQYKIASSEGLAIASFYYGFSLRLVGKGCQYITPNYDLIIPALEHACKGGIRAARRILFAAYLKVLEETIAREFAQQCILEDSKAGIYDDDTKCFEVHILRK